MIKLAGDSTTKALRANQKHTDLDMGINKSSRHQKLIGIFGEYLICNWLSRSGFEVVLVDHTGIDIIAYIPSKNQRLGITVKSRTRNIGTEEVHVIIFRKQKDDLQKLINACEAFACEPWIAVYVETEKFADVYLTSLENYHAKYRGKEGKATDDWKMGEKYKKLYDNDLEVKHIKIDFHYTNWWKQQKISEIIPISG